MSNKILVVDPAKIMWLHLQSLCRCQISNFFAFS